MAQPRRDEGTWGGMSRKMSVTLSTLPWILPAVRRPSHSTKGVWAEGTVMVWKKNVPHRLLYLNMGSPVGSTGSRFWASPHSFFSLLPVYRAWIWVRHLTVSFLFPGLYNKVPKAVSGTTHRKKHTLSTAGSAISLTYFCYFKLCVPVWRVCAFYCRCLMRPKALFAPPELDLQAVVSIWYRCQESNSGPLRKQHLLLTVESLFQPRRLRSFKWVLSHTIDSK